MKDVLLAAGIFSSLFILFLIFTILGNLFGQKHKSRGIQNQNIKKVAEGSVFALLGLLIAFSFSGAYDRFEHRKLFIIDDVNAIETAYTRTDLLNPSFQNEMRTLILNYLDTKIELYRKLSFFNDALSELDHFNQAKLNLWNRSVAAAKASGNSATLLYIPSVNILFDIASTRLNTLKVHPPLLVFLLLIWLAMLSCFLIGYSLVEEKNRSKVFLISYVAVISFTIYIIIDLEMPRVGLIRVDVFDKLLVGEKEALKSYK